MTGGEGIFWGRKARRKKRGKWQETMGAGGWDRRTSFFRRAELSRKQNADNQMTGLVEQTKRRLFPSDF